MKVDVVEATELTALHSFNANDDEQASQKEKLYGFKVGCVQRYLPDAYIIYVQCNLYILCLRSSWKVGGMA